MKSKLNQHQEEIKVGKKRRAVEPIRLEDGDYWFRNFINLTGGRRVDEWTLDQIVAGKVRLAGSEAEIDVDCPYLGVPSG